MARSSQRSARAGDGVNASRATLSSAYGAAPRAESRRYEVMRVEVMRVAVLVLEALISEVMDFEVLDLCFVMKYPRAIEAAASGSRKAGAHWPRRSARWSIEACRAQVPRIDAGEVERKRPLRSAALRPVSQRPGRKAGP